jgi:hypothetical protein
MRCERQRAVSSRKPCRGAMYLERKDLLHSGVSSGETLERYIFSIWGGLQPSVYVEKTTRRDDSRGRKRKLRPRVMEVKS